MAYQVSWNLLLRNSRDASNKVEYNGDFQVVDVFNLMVVRDNNLEFQLDSGTNLTDRLNK